MTVSSTTARVSYSGNGTTTVFPVPFYFLASSDLLVVLRSSAGVETTQVLGTNYTVTGAGVSSGGSVTMTVAPPAGASLTILRNVALTQTTDFLPNDRLPAESLEQTVDKLTMMAQQLDGVNDRSLRFPVSDSSSLTSELPSSSARAGKFLGFDNFGSAYIAAGPATPYNSEDIAFIQGGSGAIIRNVRDKLREPHVSVKDFGAVGDGTSDDTSAINNALAYAKSIGGVVTFPSGTFSVSNKIFVDSGVRGMLGLGGKIKFTTDTAMILLRGKQSGQAANVFDFTMSDLYIDANEQNINAGAGTFAVIIGENVQRCSFYNNVIEKVNWANGKGGIYLRSYLAGTAFTIYNRIIGNVITGDTIAGVNDPNGTCVAIDVLNAELNIAPYATPTAYWKATFTAANATYYGQWNVIADNVLHGGYYGVGLSAAQYTTVTGNVIRNVVRGVSVQNVSLYNNISNNVFLQMISTGVSFAYGSSHNVISSNDFQSSVCFGESVLESYVGSKDNSFNDNVIRLSGVAPKFYAYCAVQSDNCAFINNRFSGETSCASMGVESAWNNAITNPASYSFNNTSFINGFTGSGMTGVRLEGNRIANLANIPAIFTYQVSDGAGDYELTRCSIVSNIVMDSNPNYQLEMAEMSSGDSNSHILMNNSFFPTEDGPGFYLWARGRAMFAFVSGNTPVNFPVSVAGYADANATPNVAYNDYVNLATYTTPTTVTNFTGGQQGQVINVRLNTVVTIAHNANINLKNAVNLTGSSSLDFVTLLNINGTLWVEINRSLYLANPDNAVTQLTSRTTAVTNNTVRGQITLFSAAGSTSPTSFTLNNSFIAVTDSIVINQRAGTDEYVILITNIAAGSCEITFYTTGGTTTDQPIFQFSLVKNAVAN